MTNFCQYVFVNSSKNHKKGEICNRRIRSNKQNQSEIYCWEHCSIAQRGKEKKSENIKDEKVNIEEEQEKPVIKLAQQTHTRKPSEKLNLEFIELLNSV